MICALILTLTGAVPDAGQECLNAWNQRLKAAKTISGVFEIKGGGADEKVTFHMERPNRARVTGGSIELCADGKQNVIYVPEDKMYEKKRAGRRLPLIGMMAFGMEALGGAESNFAYKSFVEKGDQIVLTMSHRPGVFTVIGMHGISGEYDMTWTFDKASKTLRGFALSMPQGQVTGEYRDFKFDAPIPKEIFTLDIPQDAKPYEQFGSEENLLAIGTKAPDLTLKTTTGETITLSEYAQTRKATLVNFWYSVSGGTLLELPKINYLHKLYASQGFGAIGIAPMDSAKTATEFVSEGKFSFPTLVSKGTDVKPERLYKVETYPTTYILGSDMTIIDRFPAEDEDRALDAMEKAGIKIEDAVR